MNVWDILTCLKCCYLYITGSVATEQHGSPEVAVSLVRDKGCMKIPETDAIPYDT